MVTVRFFYDFAFGRELRNERLGFEHFLVGFECFAVDGFEGAFKLLFGRIHAIGGVGSEGYEHAIVGSDDGGEGLVYGFERKILGKHFDELIFFFLSGDGIVVDEVVDIVVDVYFVFASVAVVV